MLRNRRLAKIAAIAVAVVALPSTAALASEQVCQDGAYNVGPDARNCTPDGTNNFSYFRYTNGWNETTNSNYYYNLYVRSSSNSCASSNLSCNQGGSWWWCAAAIIGSSAGFTDSTGAHFTGNNYSRLIFIGNLDHNNTWNWHEYSKASTTVANTCVIGS
jgi:hypothetical protein